MGEMTGIELVEFEAEHETEKAILGKTKRPIKKCCIYCKYGVATAYHFINPATWICRKNKCNEFLVGTDYSCKDYEVNSYYADQEAEMNYCLQLTQENLCEINNMRNEIEGMLGLTEQDKRFALSSLLRDVLELYTPESILGSAQYELDRCRKLSKERNL